MAIEQVIVVVPLHHAAGGAVNNTATVSPLQTDPNAANNSPTASVTLMPGSSIPTLSLELLLLLGAMLALVGALRMRS